MRTRYDQQIDVDGFPSEHSDNYMKWILLVAACLLSGCVDASLEPLTPPQAVVERSAKPGPEESQKAAEPDAAEKTLRANNVVELRKRVGETVTVIGRVSNVKKTGSGRRFLNFEGGLAATCGGDDYAKFTKEKPLDRFAGKDVQLTGLVKLHQGKLQIDLKEPSQIRLASSSASPQRATLKKVGKDHWLSPAGLQYVGRDPQGRTRVEHIMRHAKNDPTRAGPHGVFDKGAQAEVFALIDEGWSLAQKRKLKPKVEGARSVYTVSFPKRIGYLGGKSGKQKRNPPLKRLLIVFESGTKKIVTAYPK